MTEDAGREKRETRDRRTAEDRRVGERRRSERRLEAQQLAARQLPDDFLSAKGAPVERVLTLVERHWKGYERGDRASLAQALVVIFEDLLRPGAMVTSRHRMLSEELVFAWLANRGPESRGEGAKNKKAG
jgi:hypothetical protein